MMTTRMLTKGALLFVLLIWPWVAAAKDSGSLFDDLIIDAEEETPSRHAVYDTSVRSHCGPGKSFLNCDTSRAERRTRPKRVKPERSRNSKGTSSSSSSSSSMFDDLPKLSSSLKKPQSAQLLQQRTLYQKHRKSANKLTSAALRSRAKDGSLFDGYSPRHRSSPKDREQYLGSQDDLDTSISILQKEKEALQNLPETIWEQALETTVKSPERETSEKALNKLANSALKLKGLFSGEFASASNDQRRTDYNTHFDSGRTLSDADLRALSNLLTQQSNDIEPRPASPQDQNFDSFINGVKESRLQDLMLALKIMQTIDESKSRKVFPNHEDEQDQEIELLLAKSLFNRSIQSMDELSESQRSTLNSFMKAMHGTLKKEERDKVSESISRVFENPNIDFAPTVLLKHSSYSLPSPITPEPPGGFYILPFTTTQRPRPTTVIPPSPVGPPGPPDPPSPSTFRPQPIGPPSTRPPSPVGPPSPPRPMPVGPPSPPQNPSSQSEGFFLTDSNVKPEPREEVFFSQDQNAFFLNDRPPTIVSSNANNDRSNSRNSNIIRNPPSFSPFGSIENVDSDTFHQITQSDARPQRLPQRNAGSSDENNVKQNYHYHYFSNPNAIAENPRQESSERFQSNSRSSDEFSSFQPINSPIRDSTYTSVNSNQQTFLSPSNTASTNSFQPISQELRTNVRLPLQNPEGRYISPPSPPRSPPLAAPANPRPQMNYGVPQAAPVADPRPSYGPPPAADPRPSYRPLPAADPRPSYGPPPLAAPRPQMTYGVPQAPPRNPVRAPVQTKVVFLRPNRGKGKGKKGKKGLFSAFSVLFDNDDERSSFRDPQFRDFNDDYRFQRESLRDEYWRNRERLYRQQQESFELVRLRQEIELQERQREEMKSSIFKRMFSDGFGGGFKDMFYKGAMALGAMSLVPLTTIIGRKRRSIEIPNNQLQNTLSNTVLMTNVLDNKFNMEDLNTLHKMRQKRKSNFKHKNFPSMLLAEKKTTIPNQFPKTKQNTIKKVKIRRKAQNGIME